MQCHCQPNRVLSPLKFSPIFSFLITPLEIPSPLFYSSLVFSTIVIFKSPPKKKKKHINNNAASMPKLHMGLVQAQWAELLGYQCFFLLLFRNQNLAFSVRLLDVVLSVRSLESEQVQKKGTQQVLPLCIFYSSLLFSKFLNKNVTFTVMFFIDLVPENHSNLNTLE